MRYFREYLNLRDNLIHNLKLKYIMKNWADALRKFNEGKPHKSPAENDREADIEFLKLLEEEKQLEEEKNPTYKNIPRFFYKKPNNE